MTDTAAADAADAQSQEDAEDIACPVSETGRFVEAPSGACMGKGACAVELDNSCRPGVAYVPATPTVLSCRCVSQLWVCDVIAGGFGLVPCSDAAAPEGE